MIPDGNFELHKIRKSVRQFTAKIIKMYPAVQNTCSSNRYGRVA